MFQRLSLTLRALALLEQKQGEQAAAAFQSILSHRGVVLNFSIGALAQLDLARVQTYVPWLKSCAPVSPMCQNHAGKEVKG